MSPLLKVLPSRKEIDDASYRRGKEVSLPRRLTSLLFDYLLVLGITFTINYLLSTLHNDISIPFVYVLFIYFTICTTLCKGSSFGKFISKIRVVNMDGTTCRWYQYGLRYFYLYMTIALIPQILYDYLWNTYQNHTLTINVYLLLSGLLFALLIIYLCFAMIEVASDRSLFYERLSKTKIISTIKVDIRSSIEEETTLETNEVEMETKQMEDVQNEQANTIL